MSLSDRHCENKQLGDLAELLFPAINSIMYVKVHFMVNVWLIQTWREDDWISKMRNKKMGASIGLFAITVA